MTWTGPPPDPSLAPPPAAHPDLAARDAYVAGALSPAASDAIELHLQVCPHCRYDVNGRQLAADPRRAERNLALLGGVIDAPRHGVIERQLVRVGAPVEVVRMMVATPSLRRSWYLAIGLALFFGVAAAGPDRPDSTILWFLGLAPLVPVLGVALAYGPGVDPSYEMTLATAVSGIRLVLLRTLAVLVTSIAIAGSISLLMLPRHSLMIGAWLVPALALSCVCLALMTVLRPAVAAAVVVVAWLAVLVAVSGAPDELVVFRAPAQVVFAALGGLATVVVVARRRSFDLARGEGGS